MAEQLEIRVKLQSNVSMLLDISITMISSYFNYD